MNRTLRLNKLLKFCLFLLIIVHLLILFRIIPAEYFWDNTAKDSKSIIISEIITICIFILIYSYYTFLLQNYKKLRGKLLISRLLVVLLVYFLFQIIGSFIGSLLLYKITTCLFYLFYFSLTFVTFVNIKNQIFLQQKRTHW